MAYSSLSIKQLITDITDNKYFLPAIQRKFVWGEEKICRLFNSIMQDYPIGTFLFWDLPADKANKYTFYEFLKNYHERDSNNSLVRYDFPREVRGVLDGQQRISSMYIALQGIFQTKRKHARKHSDSAYPERKLYLNLLGPDKEYEFRFLTDKDAKKSTEDAFYYLVRDILKQDSDVDPYDILDELKSESHDAETVLSKNSKNARRKVSLLIKKMNEDQLINYFKIVDKDLDDILDIFVRVNSGGTVLSKSDLLFSTLVAHWEDGREQIEQLISDMNGEDGLFNFNTDFLMRTCLFLVDAPMNFKVSTFDAKNINKIKASWENIRTSLIATASLLRGFGFNKARLSSNYAATPVAYYLFKGGVVDKSTKPELRKLVVHSLLKQIYSGQADTTLSGLREGFREKTSAQQSSYQLKSQCFSFGEYKHTKLNSGKRLIIDASDIDDFLDHRKGPYTFLILSVLYPDLKLDQINFHQDHMHPYSKFKAASLAQMGLKPDEINQWIEMADQLPNLQLLEGQENTVKQATHLATWVENNEADENYYRERNYLPKELSLNFSDFGSFYESRKQMLSEQLYQLFDVVRVEPTTETASA